MSLQNIDGLDVYIVHFDTFPHLCLPIRWDTEEEKPYAQALDQAIRQGLVSTPGSYGIHLTTTSTGTIIKWDVYNLIEK